MPKEPKPTPAQLRAGGSWIPAPVAVEAYVNRDSLRAVAIVLDDKGREVVVDKFARVPLPDNGTKLAAKLSKSGGPGEILRRAAVAVLKYGTRLAPLIGLKIPAKVLAAVEAVKGAESNEERISGVIATAGPSWLKDAWTGYLKAMEDGKVETVEVIEILSDAMGVGK